jgi:hypothetical protein
MLGSDVTIARYGMTENPFAPKKLKFYGVVDACTIRIKNKQYR